MITRYRIERLWRCVGRWAVAGLVGLPVMLVAESATALLRSNDFRVETIVVLHENVLKTEVKCIYAPHARLDFNMQLYSLTRLGPGGEVVLSSEDKGDRGLNRQIWNTNTTRATSTRGHRGKDAKGLDTATSRYRCRIRYRTIKKFQNGIPVFNNKISEVSKDFEVSRPTYSSPQAPSAPRITDEFVDQNRVTVRWNRVDHRSEQAGQLPVEGYTVRRQAGGTWTEVGSTKGQDSTTLVDNDPYAGPVRYAVRIETIGTRDNIDHGVAKGAWAESRATIAPKRLAKPPRNLSVAPDSGGFRLRWDVPEDHQSTYASAYEVDSRTGVNAFQPVDPLVTGGRREYHLATPVPGELYTFRVRAAREVGGERSLYSGQVIIGTDTAPLIYLADATADQGAGWVRVSWAPGPDNGNGAPRDSVDWIVRWRPTVLLTGQDEASWTTSRHRNHNTRAVTLSVRPEVVDPDTYVAGQNYEVEIAAESVNGIGAFGRLVTPNISSVTPGGSLMTSGEFAQTDVGITWWLEGPTEVFLGERVWYTLRGRRTDASNTAPLDGATDFMVRPVGVREVETDRDLHIGNMNLSRHNCGPGRNQVAIDGGGNYKVCVRTVGYDTDIVGGARVTFEGPLSSGSGSPAYLAYRPDGQGVPYGHRMEIQTRNDDDYVDTSFQVGIGLWCSGTQGSCTRANWAFLRAGDRKFTVTIRRPPPRPPSGLAVSQTQNDSDQSVYRLTWNASSNVDSDQLSGYHVYQKRGTGSFVQVTTAGSPITERQHDVAVPSEATSFAWYVTVVTTDDKSSEPSDSVQVGLPTIPPTNVQAVAEGGGRVELTWTASTDALATGYIVDATADGGLNWRVVNSDVDGESASDTGRVQAQVLHYRVRPRSTLGFGPPGNLARVEIQALDGTFSVPTTPTNVQVQAVGRHGIVIVWEPPENNGNSIITRYTLERSATGESGDFDPLVTGPIDGFTRHYVDLNLEADATWHYKVRAVNSIGHGARSESVSATTRSEAAPNAPRRLLAARRADGAGVTLSWLAPPGGQAVTGYRVERVVGTQGIWSTVGDVNSRTTAFQDTYEDLETTPVYRYRVSALNGRGPGEPIYEDAAPDVTQIDLTLADFNGDGVNNDQDTLILYYAFTLPELLGNGTVGGNARFRQSILSDYAGALTANDDGYRELITNARAWYNAGVANGSDLNQDQVVDANDALIVYYARTLRSQLGEGDSQSGMAEFRANFLGPYVDQLETMGDAAAQDTVLRGILMQAQAIALQ